MLRHTHTRKHTKTALERKGRTKKKKRILDQLTEFLGPPKSQQGRSRLNSDEGMKDECESSSPEAPPVPAF